MRDGMSDKKSSIAKLPPIRSGCLVSSGTGKRAKTEREKHRAGRKTHHDNPKQTKPKTMVNVEVTLDSGQLPDEIICHPERQVFLPRCQRVTVTTSCKDTLDQAYKMGKQAYASRDQTQDHLTLKSEKKQTGERIWCQPDGSAHHGPAFERHPQPSREQSNTSFTRWRNSATSRDRLMSLMPSRKALHYGINMEHVASAKTELHTLKAIIDRKKSSTSREKSHIDDILSESRRKAAFICNILPERKSTKSNSLLTSTARIETTTEYHEANVTNNGIAHKSECTSQKMGAIIKSLTRDEAISVCLQKKDAAMLFHTRSGHSFPVEHSDQENVQDKASGEVSVGMKAATPMQKSFEVKSDTNCNLRCMDSPFYASQEAKHHSFTFRPTLYSVISPGIASSDSSSCGTDASTASAVFDSDRSEFSVATTSSKKSAKPGQNGDMFDYHSCSVSSATVSSSYTATPQTTTPVEVSSAFADSGSAFTEQPPLSSVYNSASFLTVSDEIPSGQSPISAFNSEYQKYDFESNQYFMHYNSRASVCSLDTDCGPVSTYSGSTTRDSLSDV